MNLLKKLLPFLSLALICAAYSFAVPGVTQQIADTSGEYAFYKDSSFNRSSYIGIIYYNDSTYAFRYYSPASPKDSLVEKDITIYFSVDPTKDKLLLTGENIRGAGANDSDIINYLHDLFYEFTARRQNVEFGKNTRVTLSSDFAQFGGEVSIVYNKRIPIFSIESIKAKDGREIFSLLTTGQLYNSTDTSFTSFKGTEGLPKDKARTFAKDTKAKPQKASCDDMSVTVDSSWQKAMDNMWLLGDSAVLTIASIPAAGIDADAYREFIIRKSCQGSDCTFSLWPFQNVTTSGSTTSIESVYYRPAEASVTRTFKVLKCRKDGSYACLTLSVYDSIYQKNKAYFDTIVKAAR